MTSKGKEFHKKGAATVKVLKPEDLRFHLFCFKRNAEDEQSFLFGT